MTKKSFHRIYGILFSITYEDLEAEIKTLLK